MSSPLTQHEKFAREVRALLNRWIEESDLDDWEMAELVASAVNGWMDDEIISFDVEEEDNG
jgi:hypothetical protein